MSSIVMAGLVSSILANPTMIRLAGSFITSSPIVELFDSILEAVSESMLSSELEESSTDLYSKRLSTIKDSSLLNDEAIDLEDLYLSKSTINNNSSDNKKNDKLDFNTYSSIEPQNEILLSNAQRAIAEINFREGEKKREQLVKELISNLEGKLELYDLEADNFSSVEDDIIAIEHNYSLRILGDVIQDIYVRHFNKPNYLVGICEVLQRYDLDEVHPWGEVMLTGLMNHPDERVKESVVQLIDNWNDVKLLPILGTIEVSSDWLRCYIRDIASGLER